MSDSTVTKKLTDDEKYKFYREWCVCQGVKPVPRVEFLKLNRYFGG